LDTSSRILDFHEMSYTGTDGVPEVNVPDYMCRIAQ
jgi:hypothetical protein